MMKPIIFSFFLTVLSLTSDAQDPNVYSRAVCDNSRFCSSKPDDCDPQLVGSCSAFASWKLSSDGMKLEIGLYAQTTSYVAMGFSVSSNMDSTDVYACTSNDEILRYWTTIHSVTAATLKGVSDSSIVQENGVMYCQFSRDVSLGDGDAQFYDLSEPNGYYFIMAWAGMLDQTSNAILYHFRNKYAAEQMTNFTQVLMDATPLPPNTVTQSLLVTNNESPITTPSPSNTAQPPSDNNTESLITVQSPSEAQTENLPSGRTPLHQDESLFSLSVCGQSRFCSSHPDSCDPQMDNCQAFASWKLSDDGTRVEFALYAETSTYVAIGFTPTPSMSNTDVYACTRNGEVVRSRNNEYYSNSHMPLVGVSDMSVTIADGIISCHFSRVLSLSGDDADFFDLASSNFYSIMSWGGSLSENRINQHMSSDRFVGDFTDFTQMSSDVSTPRLVTEATGCGKTMGCFSRPANCDPDISCEVFSSWVANQDKSAITIELQATTDTYIAIGFSKSGKMEDSDVYFCTSKGEVRRARNAVGRQNMAVPLKGVSEESVTVSDGSIRCKFTRVVSLDDGDQLFFDLGSGNKYTIILAWGGSFLNDVIQIHKDRMFSPDTIDVTEISEIVADESNFKDIMRKVHGSLMVLAWLCLATLGITTARFFKDLPGKLCGKPSWFAIHRGCMSLALLTCIAAFIIIIVSVGGFDVISSGAENIVRSLHAIFGIIVTILGIVNVIMAIFRPHPGEPRRTLYNWAHWAVGTSAYLVAMATILLGTANHPNQSVTPLLGNLRWYVFWIVAGFIIFHVVLWFTFTFYQVSQNFKASHNTDDIPMQNGDGGIVQNAYNTDDIPMQNGDGGIVQNAPSSEVKQIPPMMLSLYWVYASVTSLTTVVIIISIFT